MRGNWQMENKPIALIKGIACMIVFFGHFWDCFYWYCDLEKSRAGIVGAVTGIPFYFFICGGFMVWVFCILSGYFSYRKKIEKFSLLFRVILKRYIRFFIPVLISNIIIMLGAILSIFPTEEAAIILNNSHMPQYVPELHMILKSIKLQSSNGALWMISRLFVGNCMIYICVYLRGVIKNRYVRIIGFICLYISASIDLVILSTLTGVILGVILDKPVFTINKKICMAIVIGSIFWTGGVNSYILRHLPATVWKFQVRQFPAIIVAVFLCVSVIYILENKDSILNNRIVRFLAKNSFAVFIVHIPVIYSFSLSCWIWMDSISRYEVRFLLTFIFTVVACLCLADFYSKTIGRISDRCVKKLGDKIDYCIGRGNT